MQSATTLLYTQLYLLLYAKPILQSIRCTLEYVNKPGKETFMYDSTRVEHFKALYVEHDGQIPSA